jgi:type IV pilus assembly protein PilC
MQTYTYSARDMLGKLIEGTLEVESRDEAMSRLKRDGLHVLELDEDASSFELLPRRIRLADVIFATNQLAVMVDTGINVSTALASIAEQESNSALKAVLLDLHNRVEGGEDLSSALARHPQQFDKTYVALIKAAEQTGRLGEMLETVASYLRGQLETRQKVRAAMAYPSIMAVLAVGVTIFLLTYILPKFEPLFTRKGVKLPKPTIIMMTASDILLDYWPAWIALAVALAVTYFFGRRTPTGRQIIDWLMINLPVVGPGCR